MKGPITLSISKASFPYVHFKVSQEREEVIQLQGEGARTGQLMTKPKLSFLKKKKKATNVRGLQIGIIHDHRV